MALRSLSSLSFETSFTPRDILRTQLLGSVLCAHNLILETITVISAGELPTTGSALYSMSMQINEGETTSM